MSQHKITASSNRKLSVKKQELKKVASSTLQTIKGYDKRIEELKRMVLEQLSRLQSEAAILRNSTGK